MEEQEAWHLSDDINAPLGKGNPFAAAVRATRMPMLITNPRQKDNPIVFVNDAFSEIDRIPRDEVVGRNCRFLQGPDTDQESISRIRQAIANREDVAIDLLNYRKDGTSFWNAMYISPVTDESGELLYFFASQVDVSDRKALEFNNRQELERIEEAVRERTRALTSAMTARTELLHELEHRVKNNLQLIAALILIEVRGLDAGTEKQALSRLKSRVEAIAAVHRTLYREDDVDRFDVASFVREYAAEAFRGDAKSKNVKLTLTSMDVPASHAAPIALIASELVRVVMEAAIAQTRIHLSLSQTQSQFSICVEVDGSTERTLIEPNSAKFIELLARQLNGSVRIQADNPLAPFVCVDVPFIWDQR